MSAVLYEIASVNRLTLSESHFIEWHANEALQFSKPVFKLDIGQSASITPNPVMIDHPIAHPALKALPVTSTTTQATQKYRVEKNALNK